jgi:secondary thiamine-phosphate synthase enzyme
LKLGDEGWNAAATGLCLEASGLDQAFTILEVQSPGRGLLEITEPVRAWAQSCRMTQGLLTLFCRHTSASILIQENAASAVQTDLEAFFEVIAPEAAGRYAHDDEGPDDMPAHIRAALTGIHLSIPLVEGALALGTWQGIYLFEHRRSAHRRQVALHLMGSRISRLPRFHGL